MTDSHIVPTVSEVDPTVFTDDLTRILAVMLIRKRQGNQWTSSLEIFQILRNEFGLPIHWRTIDKMLGITTSVVSRRKRNSRWEYLLLVDGEKKVIHPPSDILFVDPSKAMQAVSSLHDFLNNLSGQISICDPYLDPVTLSHISSCPKTSAIRLLTQNVTDSEKIKLLLSASHTEGRTWSVRVVSPRVLHDRYIIDAKSMMILGTSLNSFGKKQSFVIKTGDDIKKTMQAEFTRLWDAASPLT